MIILNNNFKEAFDNIRAEDSLKDSTYIFVYNEIIKRKQKQNLFRFNKFSYIAIVCVCLLTFGFGAKGYSIYFKEVSFISIDINPSIEIVLNKFDRVISTKAYNKEGQNIIETVKVKNKSFKDALETIIQSDVLTQYVNNDSYISFSVESNNIEKEELFINEAQHCANTFIIPNYQNAQIEYCKIPSNLVTQQAHSNNMSIGKYAAIIELQKFAPNISIDDCRDSNIKDIKNMTNECKSMINYDSNINNKIQMNHKGHHH